MAAARLISTITPVYNAASTVAAHVARLQAQRANGVAVEIVLVDNGSTDGSLSLLRRFTDVTVVTEPRRSSYAARNAGVAAARGDVLAFIDADCMPHPGWLQAAVACMEASGGDLIAGRIAFSPESPRSSWEIYDVVHNLDQATSVREGTARTANLLVRRSAIERVGPFDGDATSGEDVAWTRRAVDLGCRLVYCPEAVVEHPARRARELLRKSIRTGGGALIAGRARHPRRPAPLLALGFLGQCLLPPRPSRLWRTCRARFPEIGSVQVAQVYAVAYCCKLARAVGLTARLAGAPLRS